MKIKICFFYLIISILILAPRCLFGQNLVKISGEFQGALDSEVLSVNKPIAGFFNIFYQDFESETLIEDGVFSLDVEIEKAGFIRLNSKGMPKTYFYIEPGDSIHIAFLKEVSGGIKTIYTGSNAAANNLLTSKDLLNNTINSDSIISTIFQNGQSSIDIFNSLIKMTVKPIDMLQSLYINGDISKNCLSVMKSETEQKMLSLAGEHLKQYFVKDQKIEKSIKLKETEVLKLTEKLYTFFDPYKDSNRMATTNYSNCIEKSKLKSKGILPSQSINKNIWSSYDDKFGFVVSGLSDIAYAPENVQLFFIGNSLLTASVFKPMSNQDFLKISMTYIEEFPNSPYNPLINSILANNEKAITIPRINNFGIYHKRNNQDNLIELDISGIDTVEIIQSIIKKKFNGHPVFVDYWATWCSPCIAEFRYEPELHAFLKEKKVKMLYVSIDDEKSKENWEKSIDRYKLLGYHYLANPNVKKNLNLWFQGIPRYMLFDSNGDILNDNMLKPSKREELYIQIKEALGDK